MALAEAVQEAMWLQKLNSDLLGKNITITVIYEDIQSALCIEKKSDKPKKNQVIEIKYMYHFIRDLVKSDRITCLLSIGKDDLTNLRDDVL